MAGIYNLLYAQPFTSTDTVVVTHNINRRFLQVRLLVNDIAAPYLISNIIPTPGNELNELTVTLTSVQTGIIHIYEHDVIVPPSDSGTVVDCWSKIHADVGILTAGNSSTLNIVGGHKITTTAVDGSPDSLQIDFGNIALSELSDVTTGSPVGNFHQLTYNSDLKVWYPAPSVPPPPDGEDAEYSIQIKWGVIPALSGTATIPYDNTPPLITEGVQIWGETINIQDVNSTVRVTTNITFSSSSSSTYLIIAGFRDDVCIGVGVNSTANKSQGFCLSLELIDELFNSTTPPASSSPLTFNYSVRVGKAAGTPGTWYVNAINGGPYFNGLLARNTYTVEEIGLVQ